MPLYALGSNGSGQLGIGHVEDTSIARRCLFESEDVSSTLSTSSTTSTGTGIFDGSENENEILQVAAGGNHTLLLFGNGKVYAAGFNEDGRCGVFTGTGTGITSEEVGMGSEVLVRFRRVVVECLSGSEFGSEYVDVTGGGGDQGKRWDRFGLVSATWEGSFLVASSSTTTTSSSSSSTTPDPVFNTTTTPTKEKDIIFTLGTGPKGELGLGHSRSSAPFPTPIPNFPPSHSPKIFRIASGMGHTVAVLANGEVYGWGAARKGQLGPALQKRKIVWSPERIEGIPFRAMDVACGREFTVVCGDKGKGEFVVLGDEGNRWGVLSHAPSPSPSPSLSLSSSLAGQVRSLGRGYFSISASWNGVYVHLDDFRVLAWGRNDRGQLPPTNLQKAVLKKIAVGSEHALALLEDGKTVVAFGWGEHGNCGPEADDQGNVKGRYNVVPLQMDAGREIVGIAAGCATSWIITR